MSKTNNSPAQSDALVLFGVTGDLAHKMIFPALYAMAKRGVLTIPIVGVAFPKWSLEQLHERIKDSLQQSGGIDDARALDQLLSLISYVNGDYRDWMPLLWPSMGASSSKSPSDAIWPPRGNSIVSRTRCSRKTRSSASTTISERRRS